ncbi:MAG TPA: hypothetical protein VM890_16840 [Longimicrobium sp.]|nr:hypothetical protein [Longimicrobium sp.]
MKTGFLAAALAAATVAMAGCKDSTGNNNNEIASGSLAFGYTGARSGTYSASGSLEKQTATDFVKKSFATGVKLSDGAQNFVGVVAYLPVAASTGHEVIFLFPSSAAGATLNLTDTCPNASCPIGIVAFDTDPNLEEDDSDPFFFTTGTIHISSTSGGRVSGTFSGTALDFEGTRSITVTGGTFDVPLLDESDFPSANRSAPTTAFQRLRERKN